MKNKCLILCENSRVYDDPIFDKGNYIFSLDYNLFIIPKIRKILKNKNIDVEIIGMDYEALKILKNAKIPHESFENFIKIKTNETSKIAMEIIRDVDILKTNNKFKQSIFYNEFFLWDLVELYIHENLKNILIYLELVKSILDKENPDYILITDSNSIYGKITIELAKIRGIKCFNFNHTPFFNFKNLFIKKFKTYFKNLEENVRTYNNLRSSQKVSLDYKNQNKYSPRNFKVLILTDEIRHIPQIVPWIGKIDKNKIGIKIISFFPWPRECKKLNIHFNTFEQYGDGINKLAKKNAKKIITNWKNQEEYLAKNEFMVYENINLFDLLKDSIINVFEFYFHKIIKEIEQTKCIIKKECPDLVVVMDERSWPGKTVVNVCNIENIPTLVLQHGIHGYLPIYGKTYADKFAVYGEFTKEIFVSAGIDPEKIVITGGQQWDNIINYEGISKKEFCKEHGLNENKGIILYAGHLIFDREISEREVSGVIEAVKKFPEMQLIIRAHPSEPLSLYESLINDLNGEDILVFKKPHDFDSVNLCDILITQASTVAMDAIIAGKPVITINLGHGDDPYPYSVEGAVIGVYKKEDIVPAINKVLNDDNILNELKNNRNEFILRHLHKIDGKSQERIAELIKDMLNSK